MNRARWPGAPRQELTTPDGYRQNLLGPLASTADAGHRRVRHYRVNVVSAPEPLRLVLPVSWLGRECRPWLCRQQTAFQT